MTLKNFELPKLMPKLGGAVSHVYEMWWWFLLGLVSLVAVVYLLSLRRTYSIRGKRVVITGGSSGIGKALATKALHKGASAVVLVARNEERLKTAKAELDDLITPESNQKVHIVSVDVGSPGVKDAIKEVVRQMGHVDVLVNCAGITHTAPLHDTPSEKCEEILRVNVLGSIYLTQALLPAMMERREGRIVFISSLAGQLGLYGYTAYSASKYALRGLAETLQMEVKSYNIAVSISFPPDTDTPQLQEEIPQRSAIVSELASYGTVFKTEEVAREIWSGVERGTFQITHGLDGFMLGNVTAGTSPVGHMWEAGVQVMTMGFFRAVSLAYSGFFYRIVKRGLEQKKKLQ